MRRYSSEKAPILDSLDKMIIDAVKYRQFMTCRQIWKTVNITHSDASPVTVYRRVNNLWELGALRCIKKNLDGVTIRRYYCFEDHMNTIKDRFSFIENL